jgi:hypothetical protein
MTQNDILASTEAPRKGSTFLKSTSSKPSLVDVSQMEPDKLYISIYKQKVCILFGGGRKPRSNFVCRATGSSLRSIRYPTSRPARSDPFSTGNWA